MSGLRKLALRQSKEGHVKDFFGQSLEVGDRIAFIENGYRNLKKGVIAAFTPQKVRIEYPNRFRHSASDETLRFPSEVIKG